MKTPESYHVYVTFRILQLNDGSYDVTVTQNGVEIRLPCADLEDAQKVLSETLAEGTKEHLRREEEARASAS